MITTVPYLNFPNSLEALAFYDKLGATIIDIIKMSDPMFADMPKDKMRNPDFVMNASFTFFGQKIFCSDTWDNRDIDQSGSNLCFTFDQNNRDEVQQIKDLFARAEANGCTIDMPLEEAEWTDLFGSFTDPFGISWLLSGE